MTKDGLTEYTITCETALDFLIESPVGHAVIDGDGKFLWLNQAYCDTLNARREQVLGTTWMKWTHQDDLKLDEELASQVRDGTLRQYRMVKKYKQLGSTERIPRIVVGALIVFGNFDADGRFVNYRVTFDAYVPDQSTYHALQNIDYGKWLIAAIELTAKHWKTVLAMLVASAGLILGNSEKLSQTLRDAQHLKSELDEFADGSSPLPSSQRHGQSPPKSEPQE